MQRTGRVECACPVLATLDVHAPEQLKTVGLAPALRLHLIQELSGSFQICRLKAFGEPVIDFRQQLPGIFYLSARTPSLTEARCRPQLKRFRFLAACNV